MRTMLTDIAHPSLQRLGQGVLGEAHQVVGHGVRVEGDHDLAAHEGDLIPVEEHLAVLLPVPDAQQGTAHSPRLARASAFFSPSTIQSLLVRSRRSSCASGGTSRATGTPAGWSY